MSGSLERAQELSNRDNQVISWHRKSLNRLELPDDCERYTPQAHNRVAIGMVSVFAVESESIHQRRGNVPISRSTLPEAVSDADLCRLQGAS